MAALLLRDLPIQKFFFYNLSVLIKEEKNCAPNPKLKIEVSGVETLETKV